MIDPYKVIVGDCLEHLGDIGSESIHLTLSDIPYGISLDDWDILHNNTNSALGGQSPAQKKMGSGFHRRGKPINGWSKADLDRPKEYQEWCSSWSAHLLRVMKPGASVLLFCGRRTIHRATLAMEESGFHLRDLLSWIKPTALFRAQSLPKLLIRRGMSEQAPNWEGWRLGNLAPAFEPIAWFFKPYKIGGTIVDNVLEHGVGAINTDGKAPNNVLKFDFHPKENGKHPAQKPVGLLEYLINLTTQPGQTILDPFMGVGSTGVACLRTGRKFIGIEQENKYARIAMRRIENAASQVSLFQ
jgi:site-specific DNA-methyltransferase (adenine-specific)